MLHRRLLALSALVVVAAVPGAAQAAAPTASSAVLGAAPALGAGGRVLYLYTVEIPAHTKLALHHHPGTQLGRIVSGSLTYTVERGAAEVYRFAADGTAKLVRTIHAGQTAVVTAGETVVEQPTDVHRAENATGKPIEIVLASLIPKGSPLAIPVTGKAR